MPYSIQETAPFVERTSDEHEDLTLCHQLLNGADIYGVSSTGEREQTVEHTCSSQELQLWKQKLDRQVDVTSTAFVLKIKYIFIYVMSTVTDGDNHYFFLTSYSLCFIPNTTLYRINSKL